VNGLSGVRIIPDAKIESYLLNLDHPVGEATARFFLPHGFEIGDAQVLANALLAHANEHSIHRERRHQYGINREIRCAVRTSDGRDPCIIVVWFQANGTSTQRLVTAYPA
jgi:hypothetical protein